MEEKIVINSKIFNVSSIRNKVWIIGAIPVLILALISSVFWSDYSKFSKEYSDSLYVSYAAIKAKQDVAVAFIAITLVMLVAVVIGGILLGYLFSKTSITVTDKRTYGTTGFGKRVDLPNDSISAVGMCMFNGITVSTASGIIKFHWIKNRDEIQNALSSILINRQEKTGTTIKQEIPQSNADELKKYKELLNSGIISQEEFDAKKKQLLGL